MMEDSAIEKLISQKLLHKLDNQCNLLCSTTVPSMLREKNVENLVKFSFKELLEEIQHRARLLYDVVLTVCCPKKACDRNTRKTVDSKLASMGMALSILLRCRNKFMSAAQIVNSISLGRAHISKMVRILIYNTKHYNNKKLFFFLFYCYSYAPYVSWL